MNQEAKETSAGISLPCCCRPSSVEEVPKTFAQMAWRFAVAIILTAQMMAFGLGVNMTPPAYGSMTYWMIHGSFIASTIIIICLLGTSLFKATYRMIEDGKVTIEGLFTLSALGALVASLTATITGQGAVYYEVVAVVLFIYTIGKMIGSRSREKALDEINKLKSIFDEAWVKQSSGERKLIKIDELRAEDLVSVYPGELIAVDGEVIQGQGFIQETTLTGELDPVSKRVGDFVYAGSYSTDGTFIIKPKLGKRRIDDLLVVLEQAQFAPSTIMEQANRLVKYFLPFVVCVALGTFFYWNGKESWVPALFNSMSVLLVACPCALGLATPIAVWSGLWKLAQVGLVSKTGQFIDKLSTVSHIIWDKTGTLTEESLDVVDFVALGKWVNNVDELHGIVYAAETAINHPLARTLAKHTEFLGNKTKVELMSSQILPGQGIEAVVQIENRDLKVKIGEISLLNSREQDYVQEMHQQAKKKVYISIDDQLAGIVLLEERLRETTHAAIEELGELVSKMTILTGDTYAKLPRIEGVGVHYGMSPLDKTNFIQDCKARGEKVLFVGDGLNDSGAMATSDVGIAMGGAADLVKSTAMATLMNGNLAILPRAIKLCLKIRGSVQWSLYYSAAYNIIGMTLAAMGKLHPVVAALIMLVSSVFVTTRALQSVSSLK